jgi:hypothetical protein
MVFSFTQSGRRDDLPPALDIPVYRQILPRAAVELRRARRYERPLSLLVLSPRGFLLERKGAEGVMPTRSAPLLYILLGAFLRNALRETDLLSSIPESLLYAVFMPETREREVWKAVERLDAGFRRLATAQLRTGIAEFPRDGLTVENLFECATLAWGGALAERADALPDQEALNG